MRLLLSLYITLFFGTFPSFSQLGKPKMTVAEFNRMSDEIYTIESNNKDSILEIVEDMIQFAHVRNDEQMLSIALITKSNAESKFINQDQAILTLSEALRINERLNNKIELAKIYNIFGSFNYRKSNYVEATKNYLKSIQLARKIDSITMVRAYNGLSDVNKSENKFQDALKYALLAKKYITKNTPDNIVASNHLVTAIAYHRLNDFEKAEIYFIKAADLFKKNGNNFFLAFTISEQAELFYEDEPLKALDLRLQAKAIFDKIDPNRLTSAVNMVYLGELYVTAATNDSLFNKIENPLIPGTKTELLKAAEQLYKKALTIAMKNKSIHGILDTQEHLSNIQVLMGDYQNAYTNLSESKKLNDSLFSQENKNTIAKLESEKVVLELKSINQKKETLIAILIGSSLALLLILFLGYRNFKNKRSLQNLKISELEKDKQLLTVDAVLKGQEEERSRIAKDLHDGLGGLLSGTKLSFTNMKENLILTPENAIQFEKSLNMLDNTIIDLRKVAQNLMPEALVKFGLDEALRDFCNSIQTSSNITVDYQYIGVRRKLNNTAEVFVYRIVQELVNNAIKHANATEIIVQLALEEKKTAITVEDNGIGYDKKSIKNKNGSGLDNIEYRVNYLNGIMDTETSVNKGTSVNIELNV